MDTLLTHVRASWAACAGSDPPDTEVHEFLRLVHVEVVAVEGEIGHRLTGLHHRIEAWGGARGIPDRQRPLNNPVPQDRLRRHVLEAVVMRDDDPFRGVWLGGLDRLEAWTRCPALRDALRSAGLKARVSVERG